MEVNSSWEDFQFESFVLVSLINYLFLNLQVYFLSVKTTRIIVAINWNLTFAENVANLYEKRKTPFFNDGN